MSVRSQRPSEAARRLNDASAASADCVAVGEIVGTFGVRGELKVQPLTDFPDRFKRTARVYVGAERAPYAIEGAHTHKQHVLLKLIGVDDPEAGERLRGARLWIPADEITPLPADQYYVHDVVGLRVRHVNGVELGIITDVMATGGNDVFVVRQSGSGAEVLLPVVKEFVKSVDLAEGVVTVDPIAGLFDDNYEEVR